MFVLHEQENIEAEATKKNWFRFADLTTKK
jgi:hypothetical protein